MASHRSVRLLNQYYKSNEGFKSWVKSNEMWFKENPEVFRQLIQNPKMLNMFMDLMVVNSPKIQKRLRRVRRRQR